MKSTTMEILKYCTSASKYLTIKHNTFHLWQHECGRVMRQLEWFSSQNRKKIKTLQKLFKYTKNGCTMLLNGPLSDLLLHKPQLIDVMLCVNLCDSVRACGCLLEPRTRGLILVTSLRGRLWGRGCSAKLSDGTWSTCTLRWGCTATPSHME